LDKLAVLGITGTAHSWFRNYLIGGHHCVDWDGAVSAFVEVLYGVCQGLNPGPCSF
jgi:hypothetical protein